VGADPRRTAKAARDRARPARKRSKPGHSCPGIDAAWTGESGHNRVGRLDDHLQSNAAGYETASAGPAAFGARGWRGPYLSPGIKPDAWGHRYVMNVASWSQRRGALVVLSAGPNGIIDTPFDMPGAAPGGDDLIAIVAPIGH